MLWRLVHEGHCYSWQPSTENTWRLISAARLYPRALVHKRIPSWKGKEDRWYFLDRLGGLCVGFFLFVLFFPRGRKKRCSCGGMFTHRQSLSRLACATSVHLEEEPPASMLGYGNHTLRTSEVSEPSVLEKYQASVTSRERPPWACRDVVVGKRAEIISQWQKKPCFQRSWGCFVLLPIASCAVTAQQNQSWLPSPGAVLGRAPPAQPAQLAPCPSLHWHESSWWPQSPFWSPPTVRGPS